MIAPIWTGDIFGIPIGIVQIVLIAGLAMYFGFTPIERTVTRMVKQVSLSVIVFVIVVLFGLVSGLISAIVTAHSSR